MLTAPARGPYSTATAVLVAPPVSTILVNVPSPTPPLRMLVHAGADEIITVKLPAAPAVNSSTFGAGGRPTQVVLSPLAPRYVMFHVTARFHNANDMEVGCVVGRI